MSQSTFLVIDILSNKIILLFYLNVPQGLFTNNLKITVFFYKMLKFVLSTMQASFTKPIKSHL